MRPLLDNEAPEVDFLEISEDYQENEEIIELVPVVEGPSEDTNLAEIQGKPGASILIIFRNSYTIIQTIGYFMSVH